MDLSIPDCIVRLALGLSIGFCIGLTGIGGGVLVLPVLTLVLGIEPVKAVGTTSLYAFLTKAAATFQHARLKTIDWDIALRFLIGAVPANILLSVWISGQSENAVFQQGLRRFIAGVVFFSGFAMIVNLVTKVRKTPDKGKHTPSGRMKHWKVLRTAIVIAAGIVIGSLIGATSIGGGVLIIPLLIVLFRLPANRTVGTSIFIAVVLTLATSLVYGKGGEIDHETSIIMGIGSLVGVLKGSKLSTRLSDTTLCCVVIGLIFIAAVLMLLG